MTTPSTRADLVIRVYGPGQVPPLIDVVADIWADAHPELVDTPGAATAGLGTPAPTATPPTAPNTTCFSSRSSPSRNPGAAKDRVA